MLARNDRLTIRQNAAAEIKRGTREGDSVALLGIACTLGVWGDSWESSGEKMDNWDNVVLWEEGMDGYVDSLKGRVKSARFYMFSTKEGLPPCVGCRGAGTLVCRPAAQVLHCG